VYPIFKLWDCCYLRFLGNIPQGNLPLVFVTLDCDFYQYRKFDFLALTFFKSQCQLNYSEHVARWVFIKFARNSKSLLHYYDERIGSWSIIIWHFRDVILFLYSRDYCGIYRRYLIKNKYFVISLHTRRKDKSYSSIPSI